MSVESMLTESPALAAWLLWSISISLATKFHEVALPRSGAAPELPASPAD